MAEENLFTAAENGDVEAIKALCARGADVNKGDNYGCTPLYISCTSRGAVESIELLLEHGADINQANNGNYTPVHVATRDHRIDVVKALCAHDADLNKAEADESLTPLHTAAVIGYVDVVKVLCDYGANVNQRDITGQTPMHYAAENGFVDVTETLCAFGADFNQADDDGRTPLYTAAIWKKVEVVRELIVNGAEMTAVTANGDSVLTVLLESAQDLYWGKMKEGHLHDSIMLLLSAGCPVGQKDLQLMNSDRLRPVLEPRGVLDYATNMCSQPASLQHLCRLTVCRSVREPLTSHLPQLGLPLRLKQYLLMHYSPTD